MTTRAVRFRRRLERSYLAKGAILGLSVASLLTMLVALLASCTGSSMQKATLGLFATTSAVVLAAIGAAIGARIGSLARLALTDTATVVANRHAFDQALKEAVLRAKTGGMPLTLLALDVDRLKRLNDEHGHAAGDRALQLVARVVAGACRSRDLVARWGGDEFVVLMERTTAIEGRALAERIHDAIAAESARLAERTNQVPAHVTVSIGVADLSHALAPEGSWLFEAADEALRVAKSRRLGDDGEARQTRGTTVLAESPALARASGVTVVPHRPRGGARRARSFSA